MNPTPEQVAMLTSLLSDMTLDLADACETVGDARDALKSGQPAHLPDDLFGRIAARLAEARILMKS
jgi:hypothetical protein